MTRTDLLHIMTQEGACPDSMEYVASHPSSDVMSIARDCPRLAWLVWCLATLAPLEALEFSERSAARAWQSASPRYEATVPAVCYLEAEVKWNLGKSQSPAKLARVKDAIRYWTQYASMWADYSAHASVEHEIQRGELLAWVAVAVKNNSTPIQDLG